MQRIMMSSRGGTSRQHSVGLAGGTFRRYNIIMGGSGGKKQAATPGYVCPFCGTDCSPIAATPPCAHFFVTDGENGWRFTAASRALHDAAAAKHSTLFRDLLYHDPTCRAHLRLRRANYEDSLEVYIYSDDPPATVAAFETAIET